VLLNPDSYDVSELELERFRFPEIRADDGRSGDVAIQCLANRTGDVGWLQSRI
jgi:hypothetical protein